MHIYSFPWNNLFQSEYLCLFYGNKNFFCYNWIILFHFLCSHFLKLLDRYWDFWMNFYMLLMFFFSFLFLCHGDKIKQETYMIPVLLELYLLAIKKKKHKYNTWYFPDNFSPPVVCDSIIPISSSVFTWLFPVSLHILFNIMYRWLPLELGLTHIKMISVSSLP